MKRDDKTSLRAFTRNKGNLNIVGIIRINLKNTRARSLESRRYKNCKKEEVTTVKLNPCQDDVLPMI